MLLPAFKCTVHSSPIKRESWNLHIMVTASITRLACFIYWKAGGSVAVECKSHLSSPDLSRFPQALSEHAFKPVTAVFILNSDSRISPSCLLYWQNLNYLNTQVVHSPKYLFIYLKASHFIQTATTYTETQTSFLTSLLGKLLFWYWINSNQHCVNKI